jgi:hypothetical protein
MGKGIQVKSVMKEEFSFCFQFLLFFFTESRIQIETMQQKQGGIASFFLTCFRSQYCKQNLPDGRTNKVNVTVRHNVYEICSVVTL